MRQNSQIMDYEPVTRSATTKVAGAEEEAGGRPESNWFWSGSPPIRQERSALPLHERAAQSSGLSSQGKIAMLKRGHALGYAGFFLFTALVYFRPYEVFKSLSWLTGAAFWVAVLTFVIFVPTQLLLEGNLTARPREVNLILLLCLLALLSIPLATSSADAWETFSGLFIKVIVTFIVMVNAVRTRFRLMSLLFLALAVSVYVSVNAINDYRLGRLAEQGVRIEGSLGGMLQNPNDL